MHLIEVNRQSYTKNKYPYYFYKQWEDPDDYTKRVEKTFVVRRGQSTVEGPIKIKTTFEFTVRKSMVVGQQCILNLS